MGLSAAPSSGRVHRWSRSSGALPPLQRSLPTARAGNAHSGRTGPATGARQTCLATADDAPHPTARASCRGHASHMPQHSLHIDEQSHIKWHCSQWAPPTVIAKAAPVAETVAVAPSASGAVAAAPAPTANPRLEGTVSHAAEAIVSAPGAAPSSALPKRRPRGTSPAGCPIIRPLRTSFGARGAVPSASE
jgi:hypothetical protein